MEYYSATRNNDVRFEGKWVQFEDLMLSKVSQDQKHKICMFPHIWKIDPKINMCIKTNMIIYKLSCRTCLQQWNYPMELGERGKGREQ
jgi:hypothetical protein